MLPVYHGVLLWQKVLMKVVLQDTWLTDLGKYSTELKITIFSSKLHPKYTVLYHSLPYEAYKIVIIVVCVLV